MTILGACSHNYTQGGTGSAGGRDDSNTAMMDKAFANAGIDYNKTAWTWLDNALGAGGDTHNGGTDANYLDSADPAKSFDYTSYQAIHEFTKATYAKFVTSEVIGDYKDVAVVTFARSGAEGASPSLDYDGNKDTTTGRVYLELDDNEKDLLAFCKANFKETIVLVNSAEPIECGFANNSNYNVTGVLWIGHPGEAGLYGVANILAGKSNPSGHLVDTWEYDMTTNPTFYSANDQTYSNITMGSKNKYYEYNEGIYVGYRYYETAAAMGYFDGSAFKSTKFKGNLSSGKYYSDTTANGDFAAQKTAGPQATYSGYSEVVAYPFGYGLSYTSFTQTIKSADVALNEHKQNQIVVHVTNTGSLAGKSVVQLYMEAPYGQDASLGIKNVGLEKPKVQLIGFGKTQTLDAGASEDVTIDFATDDLASFDGYGQGCYALEKGQYVFHVSPNAHGWAKDSAYGADYDSKTVTLANTVVYNAAGAGKRVAERNGVSVSEGKIAVNAMNDITAGDGAMLVNGGASGSYTYGYLSRKDFASGLKEIMSFQSDDLTGKYSGNGYVWSADGTGTVATVNGSKNNSLFQRAASTGVKSQIELTPKSIEKNGISEGSTYNYAAQLAQGIAFGDGKTSKLLYGYGNDAYINEKTTRDGLSQDDASYANSKSGTAIQWNATYYVALKADSTTVKDSDGYVKIYDTEAAANAEGTATKLQCSHMGGVPSSDLVRWDKLANELSFKEADDLMGENGWHCYAAASVGKSFELAVDGPGEAGNAQNAGCTWWPCAVIIAATWNTTLAKEEGVAYGHQDLLNNVPYCYAPAMNTHRTPFGGRDFEYYSEDGFIAGEIGGHVVEGLESVGMHVFIKHYALNDSDTNRGGVNTWADEQSIREIYAKPYEICCKYYNADGMMGSLNSMGMAWAHTGFYQDMTRDEWSWHGMLITDGDGSSSDVYNNYSFWTMCNEGGILGSGDLSANKAYTTIGNDGTGATAYQKYMLHNIARNALFQYSHNIDAFSANVIKTANASYPTTLLVVGDGVAVAAIVIVFFALVFPYLRKRKEAPSAK